MESLIVRLGAGRVRRACSSSAANARASRTTFRELRRRKRSMGTLDSTRE